MIWLPSLHDNLVRPDAVIDQVKAHACGNVPSWVADRVESGVGRRTETATVNRWIRVLVVCMSRFRVQSSDREENVGRSKGQPLDRLTQTNATIAADLQLSNV
jgi:hypothetical protein